MRDRFAGYVAALRGCARSAASRDVPFLINIHGTEGGNGAPFPIGISQLVDTYAGVARHGRRGPTTTSARPTLDT